MKKTFELIQKTVYIFATLQRKKMKQTAKDRGRTVDFIDVKNGISGGPAVRSILSNRVTN